VCPQDLDIKLARVALFPIGGFRDASTTLPQYATDLVKAALCLPILSLALWPIFVWVMSSGTRDDCKLFRNVSDCLQHHFAILTNKTLFTNCKNIINYSCLKMQTVYVPGLMSIMYIMRT
jgi:hypothetical protein